MLTNWLRLWALAVISVAALAIGGCAGDSHADRSISQDQSSYENQRLPLQTRIYIGDYSDPRPEPAAVPASGHP